MAFVMDCYGAMGTEAISFLSKVAQRMTGKQDFWWCRKTEDTVWQGVSFTLAREVARQLVWSRYSDNLMGEVADQPVCHSPYSC